MEAIAQPTVSDALTRVRASLHRFVDKIDDMAVLEALTVILQNAQPAVVDSAVQVEQLSPAERIAVEEGIQQLDAGQGRPHAEVWASYEARYGVKYPA